MNCAILRNSDILIIRVNMSFALFLNIIVISVVLNEKQQEFTEGHISRRDGYYISRDISRVAIVTIIEGRVAPRDR